MTGNPLMEEIMAQLREHLRPVVDMGAGGNVHHYNRAWEKIEAWHKRHLGGGGPIGGMRQVMGCPCGYVRGEQQPSNRARCPHGHGALRRMVLSWTAREGD